MPHPEPDTRQARRAARRRAEILDAAAKVFAEKGFSRSTMKDVADAADIAEGTIYNYFESKDDLLISLIDKLADLEARRETYAHSIDVDFRQAFHDQLAQRFAMIRDRNKLFMAILPEVFVSPHLRELYQQRIMIPGIRDLEEHFRARIEHGQLKDSDVPIVMRLFAALALGIEVLVLMGDTELQALYNDPHRLVDVIMHAAFDGILSIPPQPSDSDSPSARGE